LYGNAMKLGGIERWTISKSTGVPTSWWVWMVSLYHLVI
jgi:hypothetical protein